MTMGKLRPVEARYRPGYPATLTEAEIRDLLRPCLLRRFPREAVLIGAIAAGAALAMPACARDKRPALPKAGITTRTDAAFARKIDKLVRELLPKKKGFWGKNTSLVPKHELKPNPAVKYPRIRISFGNSRIGVFDTAAARQATLKLFEAYGIKLKKDVPLKRGGYEFVADGFDEKLGIGFELVMPAGRVGFGRQTFTPEPDAKKLDAKEQVALGKVVADGKLRVFVAHATGFPNMDGDLYTPMQYYLTSVVDYLNWVHGDRQIDGKAVLLKQKP
jgi:hypothetical protein